MGKSICSIFVWRCLMWWSLHTIAYQSTTRVFYIFFSFFFQSMKSATVFDKPDLLKASQPSLSNHSAIEESNFSEIARYNVSKQSGMSVMKHASRTRGTGLNSWRLLLQQCNWALYSWTPVNWITTPSWYTTKHNFSIRGESFWKIWWICQIVLG